VILPWFLRFSQKCAVFFTIFCRDFLLSLSIHRWKVLSVRNNSLADNVICLNSFSRCCLPICQLAQNSEKIWTYRSSRSSKVDDFGANRKRICKFLLLISITLVESCTVSDIGDLLAENCVFFIPLSYSAPPLLSSLWNFTWKLSARKLESWGYSVVKVAWS